MVKPRILSLSPPDEYMLGVYLHLAGHKVSGFAVAPIGLTRITVLPRGVKAWGFQSIVLVA